MGAFKTKHVGFVSLSLFYALFEPVRSVIISMHVCECDQITKRERGLISPVFIQAMDVHPAVESNPRPLAWDEVVVVPWL